MPRVLIEAAGRTGRTFKNEAEFRTALARGDEVFTRANGVFFGVTLKDDDTVLYTALTAKPEGL